MSVCEECGLNIEIMGTHLPACSLYEPEEHRKAVIDAEAHVVDGVEAWNAVMETAGERGAVMGTNMMKAYLIDSGFEPPDEFDGGLADVIAIASWAGVLSAIQVFSEQGFIDKRAIVDFTRSVPNFKE